MKKSMKSIIVILLGCTTATFALSQNAQVVFNEDFNDNTNNWDIDNEEGYSSNITNGNYVLKNMAEDASGWVNNAEYDPSQPFTIEAKIKYTKVKNGITFLTNYNGWETPVYGFMVVGKVAKPMYYSGSRYSDAGVYGKQIENIAFTKDGAEVIFKAVCEAVKGSQFGQMEMTFYINGQEIGKDDNFQASAESTRFGFYLEANDEIEVDYIKINSIPVVTEVANQGYISTSRLGTAAPSNSISSVNAGDPIFTKIYMKESFGDMIGGSYSVQMNERVSVNGKEIGYYDWTMNSSELRDQGNSYEVDLAPDLANTKYPRQAFALSNELLDLPPGVHQVKLEVFYNIVGMSMSNTLGEVTFEFNNTDAKGREDLAATINAYLSQGLKNTKMPVAKMSNATLEQSVKNAIVNEEWVQTPLKVVIMESDWSTLNDRYTGAILQRYINVAVGTKDRDGECMIFYPTVYQDYLGGGKYSTKTTLGGIHLIEQNTDCGNVN